MRKIVYRIAIIVVITAFVVIKVCFVPSDVKDIRASISSSEEKEMNAGIQHFYEVSVVDNIINHKEDLILSDVSEEQLRNAQISQGVPLYTTQVKKLEVGDFKNQLTLYQWMFLVYVGENPVATFFTSRNENGLILENIMDEEFSKAIASAIDRVKSDRLIAFTIRLNYYIANEQDEVAIVDRNNTMDEVVRFDEVETAVDRSIEYYEGRPEDEVGGDYTVEYLYGNNKKVDE